MKQKETSPFSTHFCDENISWSLRPLGSCGRRIWSGVIAGKSNGGSNEDS